MTWLPRDPALLGLDPDGYDTGQVPVKDPSGLFVPGVGAGAGLSDADPQPLGDVAPGVSENASRADHIHPLGPWTEFLMASPDGAIWTVTMGNTGVFVITALPVRGTDTGGTRTTDTGAQRLVET